MEPNITTKTGRTVEELRRHLHAAIDLALDGEEEFATMLNSIEPTVFESALDRLIPLAGLPRVGFAEGEPRDTERTLGSSEPRGSLADFAVRIGHILEQLEEGVMAMRRVVLEAQETASSPASG